MLSRRRETLLAWATLVVIALLVGDRVVVTPALEAWSSRAASIADLENTLLKGKALANQEERWRREWAKMQERSLPKDAAVAQNLILKSVDEWARENQMALTTVKPRSVQEKGGFEELEIRATGSGSLEAVARFVWALETSPLALRVEEIDLAAGENEQDPMQMGIRFTGLLNAPATPASAAPAAAPAEEEENL